MKKYYVLCSLSFVVLLSLGCSSNKKEVKQEKKPSHQEIVQSEKERCEVFCRGECERLKAFGGPSKGTETSMIQATGQMADADQLKRLCACKCETEMNGKDKETGTNSDSKQDDGKQ